MGLQDSKSLTLKNDKIDYLLSDEYEYKTWIKLEKIVAETQAELGLIPTEAAEAINKEVTFDNFSVERYQYYLNEIGHGFYSFVEAVLEPTSEMTKKYFHYGITTQNIQQSSQMLIIYEVNKEFKTILLNAIKNLADLDLVNKLCFILVCTHSNHAYPTTYGYVVYRWLEEL